MNPHLAYQLAAGLMKQHGLDDWTVKFNRRKRVLGLCNTESKLIELSMYFVSANSEVEVRDVILHEIAHALAGHEEGHGPRWKQICRRIGANPERLNNTAEMPRGNYVAVCEGCDMAFRRHRKPAQGYQYFCSQCGDKAPPLRFIRKISR